MAFTRLEITEAVTALVSNAKFRSGKKLDNKEEIIERTVNFIAKKSEALTTRAELRKAAEVYSAIFAKVCASKYFTTLDEASLAEVIEKTFTEICAKYSDTSGLLQTPQKVNDILSVLFLKAKSRYLRSVDSDAYEGAYKLIHRLKEHLNPQKEEIDFANEVADDAMNRFIKSYEPYGDISFEIVARRVFVNAVNSFTKSTEYKIREVKMPLKSDAVNDEIEFEEKVSYKDEKLPDETFESVYAQVRKCEIMRDLFAVPNKLKISNIQLPYFRCFYTDGISYMQDINKIAYCHIKKYEKQYMANGGLDMDFLNYFVDSPCEVISDAYKKPRAYMSRFKNVCDEGARCAQPLEGIVTAQYLKKSEGSVSQMKNKYRDQLRLFLTE